MITLECKCGNFLNFNKEATQASFLEGVNIITSPLKLVVENLLFDYMVYSCNYCGRVEKYTYKEVEEISRKYIMKDVINFRKSELFKQHIDLSKINPDNGFEYCGVCEGADGKGNCYSDIIKICNIKEECSV